MGHRTTRKQTLLSAKKPSSRVRVSPKGTSQRETKPTLSCIFSDARRGKKQFAGHIHRAKSLRRLIYEPTQHEDIMQRGNAVNESSSP